MYRDHAAPLRLPRDFAAQLRREAPSLAAEMLREIRQQIPEYDQPLGSLFSSGLLLGVETALAEFADVVEGRGTSAEQRARIYRGLGRAELAEGRSMDSLQSAVRLGGRIAWRRYVRVARRVGMRPDQMVDLAEAVFTHVDQIATACVLGYAHAKADIGEVQLRRRRLLELLVSGAARSEIEEAAEAADWALPDVVACVALGPGPSRPVPRLPEEALTDASVSPYLLLPDPEQWLGKTEVVDFLRQRRAVVGPVVPLRDAAESLRWARSARERLPEHVLEHAPVRCDQHLTALLLLGDLPLVRLIGERRLAPLAALTAKQCNRLEATLLAWLDTNRGSAPQVASRLGIHPQTARSRLHRVQELFGPALTDPESRFEIEVALRGRLIRSNFDQGTVNGMDSVQGPVQDSVSAIPSGVSA